MSTTQDHDPRTIAIWSVNAWVGMAPNPSTEAKAKILDIALKDRLPDVTGQELGYAMGLITPH